MSILETNDSNETGSEVIYDAQDLCRTFSVGDTEVKAVNSISLKINAGDFVSIEGPSGSGKTTLLQLLGLLDRPTSGTLLIEGNDISSLGDNELTKLRRSTIGFIFQQFNLIPTLTAIENVEAAMVGTSGTPEEHQTKAKSLLARVGLESRAEHLPTRLSGGEQQRVAIARALANDPRVILADEPTGNLDSTTSDEIVKLLVDLKTEKGVTVIIITHDHDIAKRAEHSFKMRDGALIE